MRKHSSESSHVTRRNIVLFLTVLLFLSGGSVYYWRSNSVRLTADNKTRRIFTKARTMQEFLDAEKIFLGPDDLITPPLETFIDSKTAAKITRVVHETIVEVSSGTPTIKWQVQNRQNLRRVRVQRGYSTITTTKNLITRHDSLEVSRTQSTKKKKRVTFYTLTLLDTNGRPVKEYDLLKAKVMYMRSTGYYVGEKYVPSDTTFLGHKLRRGLVAVDPKVIPLRTRLYVEGYGYAYASDTGSRIKKNRIDLAVKDKYEEARFNRYNVPVYILEKSKSW